MFGKHTQKRSEVPSPGLQGGIRRNFIYSIFSFGNLKETAKESTYGLSLEADTSVWGIGLGIINHSAGTTGFGLGGEVRYLSVSDSQNAGGIFQAYLMVGIAF